MIKLKSTLKVIKSFFLHRYTQLDSLPSSHRLSEKSEFIYGLLNSVTGPLDEALFDILSKFVSAANILYKVTYMNIAQSPGAVEYTD